MPIYEYECDACKHRFEAIQKISDKPLKSCEKCNSDQVRRLISSSSFVLKGGGWYADNYAAKSGKTSNSGSESKTSDSESKTKTESKPAKSESKSSSSD